MGSVIPVCTCQCMYIRDTVFTIKRVTHVIYDLEAVKIGKKVSANQKPVFEPRAVKFEISPELIIFT